GEHFVWIQRRGNACVDLVQDGHVLQVAAQLTVGPTEIGGIRFELGRPLLLELQHFGWIEVVEGHSEAASWPDLPKTDVTESLASGRRIQRSYAQTSNGSASGGRAYASTSTPGIW